MIKEDFLRRVEEDVSLREYNTMRVECSAKFFVRASNVEDVVRAVKCSQEKGLPFLIMGKGSNIILPSAYEGFVIFMDMKELSLFEEDMLKVNSEAGVFLPAMAKEVTEKGAHGMEWAGGVPGTVGGAIRGNAGAFDCFISDFLKEVTALNIEEDFKKEVFKKEECFFDYRNSFFKRNNNYIILSASMEFPFKKGVDDKFKEYLRYRRENHPLEPSAGSIFKNPSVKEEFYLKHPEMEKFRDLGFIPARVLIEECGLKGANRGGAQISEKHPNFIINKNGARGEDVKKLIELAKEEVKKKFFIEMKEEVTIVK